MSPPTSRPAYGVLLVALLSLVPAAHAQSACGLQGFSSCTSEGRTTGYGCCPTGWECYASECSYTGTPTLPATTATTTTCPGMPAHYLCPASLGGNCCYSAHACDPNNVSQCILTQTERVFDQVVTTTTIVGSATQTITSTTIYYPWPTIEPRMTPASTTTQAPSVGAAGHGGALIGGVIGGIVASLLVQY